MNPAEYEVMFRVEDGHWWYRGLRGMLRMAWDEFAPAGGADLLDVGCGTGANLAEFHGRATSTGLDHSLLALKRAEVRGLSRLINGDAVSLPFRDASFDVIFHLDVLCHRDVRDRAGALAEVRRVLRPGGHVFINVPAYDWLRSSHDEAVHTALRFTRRRLKELLERANLTPMWMTYWNSLLFPIAVGVRLWRTRDVSRGSDLQETPGALQGMACSAALRVERAVLRITPLPFGLSVFAVARK